ncbi:hypothetical protein N7468_007202 [Penicillium chermesinum]|uniref:GYF domain-containing protein n=1 Tax=Penicillium chermesinum TaxID=63820 RepID=A0A9W9TKA7_9EURO|nr:uncharacterized protein N7468_007202 [Penicillium chermesinum]KAJ5225977.1 hypothetical protein N7468_007202 [Penicillium chermesinum]
MPTPLPSSFASAAAGQTQDPARRGDGEWSRSRTNGATQTFRRPSVATNSSHIRDSSQPASAATPTSSTYMPSQMSSNILANVLRNGDARYSKDQLLEFYKLQRESGIVGKNVEDYFVGDWDPNLASNPVNGAWGKRDDHKTSAGPEVCWDHGGNTEPLGLTDMTEAEKELFAASVNSPLKPPPTNNAKENTVPTQGGRKGSVSYTQGHINNFNTSSPTATRPGGRRRETGDSNANPMSPTAANSRFFRDEANTSTPPPALLRRKTDFRDSGAKTDERTKEGTDTASPFGSLKRSSTNPLNTSVGAVGGPSSPWGVASASASMSPMGAFGAFSLGSGGGSTPTTEKKPGYGSLRGESRFKGLLSKDSSEDIAGSAKDKNLSNLERLVEDGPDNRAQSPWADTLKTRMGRSETNPFDEPRSGSAALGGSQDVEAPSQADAGFAAFGMTSSIPGFRELMQSQESSRNATPSLLQGHEPTSPTNTNPYQSPHADRDQTAEAEDEDTDVDLTGVDRSQNSSVNANRTFSGLGNLSGLSSLGGPSGWPGSGTIGTPTRERPAFAGGFGDSIFGSMGGELQSPSLSTLGGAGGLFSPHAGISGTASIGRSSKLGALFSPALHDDQGRPDSVGLEDPARQFDLQDKVAQAGKSGSHSASETPLSAMGSIPVGLSHDIAPGAQTPGGGVPSAQQRTMVMPDRMRWIYRDPQGNIQGPWTGLEMHDWFKAGFFSPDLQIKKLEDDEFEPLAQLVRRIGNSREPFLVPQIGIPHGPEPTTAQWTGNTAGSAQPPFPGSFPSFGTTLTAEQQNALERRKQEEQYLMARQKEHLAQQQAIMKSIHPGAPSSMQPQLQHQSSAHSLHSQPSFGSIASPGAYQPSPIQAPMQQQSQPGFFDSATQLRQGGLSNVGPGILSSELGGSQDQLPALLDRLNVGVGRQDPFAFGTGSSFAARQPDAMAHSQQVASMLSDRQALREEQEQFDKANANDPFDQEAREERLRQFHALRAQEGELGLRTVDGLPSHPASGSAQQYDEETEKKETANEQEPAELTLSQQVQKAASAQRQQQEQKQHSQAAPESVWGTKPDHGMPQPFPPPPSASPLPAPAAQRNRQNVAESLAAGSRSQTQTPGPSLKEIQEAEARNAAQREEVAAAARRAQLLAEQERLSQAQAQAVPGLPSSSTWASSGSPATPTSTAGSVWSNKAQPTPAASTAKKTLAQIQKEEEARKQRLAVAAASAAQTATPSPPASVGKRYADLASKAPASASTTPVAPAATGAWTTVGAGGKAKAPPAAPLGPRSASGSIPSPALSKSRPATGPRTVTLGNTPTANPNRAVEEFTKWAKLALGKGLNSNINVDDFVQQLLLLPAEAEIISDSVYANSQTLDGRRFADEFIRRRKLSDKGIVEPVSPSAFGSEQGSGGGWSEVAKKGSAASASAAAATATQREEEASNAAFKVVAPRKKGKR